jgi:hypothetical protein
MGFSPSTNLSGQGLGTDLAAQKKFSQLEPGSKYLFKLLYTIKYTGGPPRPRLNSSLAQKTGLSRPVGRSQAGLFQTLAFFPTTRPPLAFSNGDHLRFLRPEALARLCDSRLHCLSRVCSPPLPSSPEPASSSPPPGARGHEGVMVMPYFTLRSRLHAPRCP